jgi:hypothetical protein
MIFDRPHQHRFATGRIEHRVQQKRCRRLAVGPGYAGQHNLRFGAAEEIRADRRHRSPSAARGNFGDTDIRIAPCCIRKRGGRIRDHRGRSLCDGFADVAIAIRGLALHRQKQRARSDAS